MENIELVFDFHHVADEIEIDLEILRLVNYRHTPDLNAFIKKMRNNPYQIKTNSLSCIAIVCDIEKLMNPPIATTPYLRHLKQKLNKWAKIHIYKNNLEIIKFENHEKSLQKHSTNRAY